MNFYFAPMEGITGYIFRNAHHTYYNQVDKYFSPFITASQHDSFKGKERNDILPDNNPGVVLIPQLLTNNAKDFNYTAKKLKALGYDEINLNLGCPSGTVVSKYRGSGFLAKPLELDAFLEEIFAEAVTKISIKTRIGKEHPEEFYQLMEIYNKYPMEELIIHPRIQKDFYKNTPNMEIFRYAVANSKNRICYNGDIFTACDYRRFQAEYPEITRVMLGRGLLSNPGLIAAITEDGNLSKERLLAYHNEIYVGYKELFFGDRNVLFKMKELWLYLIKAFSDSDKYAKKIKKSERCIDYEEAVARLFEECELIY